MRGLRQRADVEVGRPDRRLLGVSGEPATVTDEPFTRADPVLAPLCRNTVLTAPAVGKRGAAVRF